MVSLKDKWVNWVENLPNYVRFLNELARDELGWRSPFEIYYGRVLNFVKKIQYCYRRNSRARKCESKRTIRYRNTKSFKLQKKKKNIRQKSKKSERMNKRINEKHDKRYKNEVFQKGDIVLVRLGRVRGGKRGPQKRFIVEGKVINKSSKSDN